MIGVRDFDDLSSHSIYGESWEGFVIEHILQRMPQRTEATYHRSSAGAEIDLVLETPKNGIYAIEIKRTLEPVISKGFPEIQPKRRFYVLPIDDAYPLDRVTEVIGIERLLEWL